MEVQLAFPTIITLDAICMGLLARASAVIGVRIAGMVRGADAPMRIKAIAGTSLQLGVLICGRMLTWFRPPFFTDQPDALPAI